MASVRDIRRINLAIKKWSAYSLDALLTYSPDDLVDKFKTLTPEEISELDQEIDQRPAIIIPRTYRNNARIPSDEGFYTPPRSSKSSGAVSKGCHSTP